MESMKTYSYSAAPFGRDAANKNQPENFMLWIAAGSERDERLPARSCARHPNRLGYDAVTITKGFSK